MTEFLFVKILNVCLSFGFLLIAYAGKRKVGTLLNPVSIFSLFWFLYVLLPLLVAFEAPVSSFANLYILFFCLMIYLPSHLFDWRRAFIQNSHKLPLARYFSNNRVVLLLIFLALFASIFTLIGMLKQGFTINQMLSNPISIGGIYANRRYASEIVNTRFSQVGLSLSYVVVVLGGIIYGARAFLKSREFLIPISFIPALSIMILQSAKGLFIFSIFLFIGGILVARIYSQRYYLFSLADFRKLFIYGVVGLPFIIASFLSRGIYNAGSIEMVLDRLRYYLTTYSSVHLPAFSDWFTERYFNYSIMAHKQEELTLGFYTFTAFFRLAGDERQIPLGVYDEFFQYGDYVSGNLYTVFRGLITDFSLIGSLIFGLFVGLLCNVIFWNLLTKREGIVSIILFIYFVGISYQTYIISSLTWLTIPFVIFLQYLLMFYIMKVRLVKI